MNINWKLRLMNKTTLITLATTVITMIYSILAVIGIVPSITQDQVMNIAVTVIAMLSALGIVVDPTTSGIGDSDQAMGYERPKTIDEQTEVK